MYEFRAKNGLRTSLIENPGAPESTMLIESTKHGVQLIAEHVTGRAYSEPMRSSQYQNQFLTNVEVARSQILL